MKCRSYLKSLEVGISGRHGPVSDQSIYDVMCMDYCVINDRQRIEAMEVSYCDCKELSTQPDEVGYSLEGDFCRENSGRMMCEELERCGVWDCNVVDFLCPRMEYDQSDVELRGKPGECTGAGSVVGVGVAVWGVVGIVVMVLFN